MEAADKARVEARLREKHDRAKRNLQKLEIDLTGTKLDHQKERIYSLMVYHLDAKARARIALEELDKL